MNINSALRSFNDFWDAFVLELIKPLAIASMGLGTVAIFNLQGLALNPTYVMAWAIIQALSIDGLFFASWDRLWMQKRENTLAILGLALIGLVLALVAIAINAILGYQVLWAIADSGRAMNKLGISSSLFVAIRAILSVIVFIMMSFVRARVRAQVATKDELFSNRAVAKKRTAKKLNEEALSAHEAEPGSPKRALIEAALQSAMASGEKLNLKAIADELGVGYSTVRLYHSRLKRERHTADDIPALQVVK